MRPGIARAVSMGILGFALGALLAVGLRLLQGLDPNPANPYGYVGPAFVLGAFFCAGFFIWGIGAFDARLNVHGEEPEAAAAEAAKGEIEAVKPLALLTSNLWQISFWLIVVIVAIAIFAFLPFGPTIQSVAGDGNPAAVGYTTMALPFGGPTVTVSYLVLFIVFVIWTLLSLAVVAGLLAFILNYFSRGKKNPDATPIPWRAVIFVLVVLAIVPLPLLFPTYLIPTAFLMPAIVLVPLLLVIGYPNVLTILLLVITLGLPMFFSNIQLSLAALFVVGFILGVFLLLPVFLLRAVIPRSIWQRYATVEWNMIIPRFAHWVARLLRGLPEFMGQR
ncbi:MAG TPA: hypothetical protein VHO69_00315 [Phototrophicaceae bacterium]|nr:hypothetical protein [Phototrophicaceae bacterium]